MISTSSSLYVICNADSINTHLFVTQSHGPFPGTFIFQQTISRSKDPYLRSFSFESDATLFVTRCV